MRTHVTSWKFKVCLNFQLALKSSLNLFWGFLPAHMNLHSSCIFFHLISQSEFQSMSKVKFVMLKFGSSTRLKMATNHTHLHVRVPLATVYSYNKTIMINTHNAYKCKLLGSSEEIYKKDMTLNHPYLFDKNMYCNVYGVKMLMKY